MRKRLACPLAVLVSLGATCLAGARPHPLLERNAVVETDVMVPMRDGVKLATDLVRPKGEGKFPVILTRTPYRKNLGPAGMAVAAGYAFACQDVRGRFASEGDHRPFLDDPNDAFDTIAWLARQPWCDGNVGMMGGSYVGYTQLAAAMTRPPALRCILPGVPPSDFDHRVAFFGGALRQELVQGWLIGQAWSSQRVQRKQAPAEELQKWQPHRNFMQWCWHLPLTDPGPLTVGGPGYVNYWLDGVRNWEKPGLWRDISAVQRAEDIQVPVCITAGFYDIFTQENLDLLLALRTRGGSDLARKHSHILIGPWPHGIGSAAGDANFPSARSALGGIQERWFARWLKNQPNDADKWPPIRAYIMGQDRWLDTDTWPPAASKPTKLYLAKGKLAPEPPKQDEAPSAFTYDPAKPVPTLGGNNLIIPKGMKDHRKNAERPDVRQFLTEPLDRDLAVVGTMRAHLFVSSSAPDTDFTAMLLDVRPDGYQANIQDGIVRCRYREGRGKPKLLKPGEVVEVEIDLWSTAYVFKKGNRIALHISSSNFPRFDRNLNVADHPASWAKPQAAENKLYHDPAHASYVELSVLP
ncbi:MAG TPA: CocE/NonD family hydrolase [Planctomycetota bacterium]|nr:CocE/NonD family hydrolase [Planctomycetota bacterium]